MVIPWGPSHPPPSPNHTNMHPHNPIHPVHAPVTPFKKGSEALYGAVLSWPSASRHSCSSPLAPGATARAAAATAASSSREGRRWASILLSRGSGWESDGVGGGS